MYKFSVMLVLLLMTMNFAGLNAKVISSDSSQLAYRSMDENRGDFNRNDDSHNDFNHNNFNHNDNMNRQDFNQGAYGADRGAAYGAAAGSAYGAAAGNASTGVPVNPNAAEQNMLYYSGAQNMEQGQ